MLEEKNSTGWLVHCKRDETQALQLQHGQSPSSPQSGNIVNLLLLRELPPSIFRVGKSAMYPAHAKAHRSVLRCMLA